MRRAATWGGASAIGLALGLLIDPGCGFSNAFQCETHGDCDLGGEVGQCEPQGGCSYMDPSCDSGRRFSNHAPGGLAGLCTMPPGTTGATVVPTDPSLSTSGSTLDLPTGDPATSDSATSDPTTDPTGVGTSNPADGWRREVTVIGDAAGPQTDVPVRIRLAAPMFDLDEIPDPEVLRFVDLDEQTVLPHQIEHWSEDEAEIWVLVPTVDVGPTSIWMWYEPGATPMGLDPSVTWPDALGVWHLDDGLVDASPSANHGILMEAAPAEGMIAGCHTYDGFVWDELPIVGSSSEGTVELWFRGDDQQLGNPSNGMAVWFHASSSVQSDGYGPYEELYLGHQRTMDGVYGVFRAFDPVDDSVTIYTDSMSQPVLDDQWHHILGTWSASEGLATLWYDGVEVYTDGSVLDPGFAFTEWIQLGGVDTVPDGNDNRYWTGEIDEVRFYDFAFSATRARIEYVAQLPGFATVGAAMPLP